MTTVTLAPTESAPEAQALQPLLNDAVIVLRAPTQVWSDRSGDIGAAPIHGIYHGDVRHVRSAVVSYDGRSPEGISVSAHEASRVTFGSLLRGIDDASADPKVRLLRERLVEDGVVTETLTVRSRLTTPIATTLRLRVVPEFAPLQDVKAGLVSPAEWSIDADNVDASAITVSRFAAAFTLHAPGATLVVDGDALVAEWPVEVAADGTTTVTWSVAMTDPSMVVRGVTEPSAWAAPGAETISASGDPLLARWLDVALDDLEALRLALPGHPEDSFYAAGTPWFFTLFGRDSIWAARLALPVDRQIAASTLRVLARLQGTVVDPATAQQPGKILHELRSAPLELPGEGVSLPPVYYGTVDATPLFICLLTDAWRAGMPEAEVRELLPALHGALDWLLNYADADGDGFLDYIDETGHGLANQGWKDSGDSIQWRGGALAQGPIALCEVQGYAYEAALGGAALLEAFGEPGSAELIEWAAALKARFAKSYWVETPEGRYPAIALDANKRPVDTLTSNIGHLLGTGILSPEEEAHIAGLLVGESMLSGFGVRTMSTDAGGYWPLSYHGGSVWMHDTAIVAHGMARAGLQAEALQVVAGLVAAAEGFNYRVPELHSGDPARETRTPVPYPAACRPQAWSAAAAVTCAVVRAGAQLV